MSETPGRSGIPEALLQLQEVSEEAFEARNAGCLARVPALILSLGTPSGGRFTLIHRGREESVEPVDVGFAVLKYVAHAPMALFGLIFGDTLAAPDPDLEAIERLRKSFRDTLEALDQLPVDPESRASCQAILERSLAYAEHSELFERGPFTRYAQEIAAPTAQTMRRAAQLQLEGIGTLVARWREQMGESDWAGLVAAVASGWARVNNSPRQQALEHAMGAEAARQRLFTIQGVKTQEALLQRLGKILNQQELGEVFFGERERMSEDLMGRPASAILEARL